MQVPVLRIIFVWVLFTVAIFVSLQNGSSTEGKIKVLRDRTESRVVLGDKEDGLFYFVQLSDLHINHFTKYQERTKRFEEMLRQIKKIDPEFVVVTGDLVDARDSTGASKQFKEEWETYRSTLERFNYYDPKFWIDLRQPLLSYLFPYFLKIRADNFIYFFFHFYF